MRRSYGTTRIFAETELREYLEQRKSSVIHCIESESDDYLLNVNESDYVKYKADEALAEPLEIHEDQIYASSSEQMTPAEYFPNSFCVHSGKSYKKDVIKFHIPFSGNTDLLKCVPSSRLLWTMDVEIADQEFTFEIINFSDDVESIAREKDSNMRSIIQQLDNVSSEVQGYNSGIETQIKQAFEARKLENISKEQYISVLRCAY